MIIQFFFSYIYFYFFALVISFAIFWMWLMYADRLHLREIFRKLGKKVKTNLTTETKVILQNVLFNQLNTLSEILAGFTCGLMFDEPTIKVVLMVDNETSTEITTCNAENQTDHIEPEIKEIIKEIVVIKEVIKEVIREETKEAIKEVAKINTNESMEMIDIFSKNNDFIRPTLDDDIKADDCIIIQEKPKRVRVKQKQLVK